MKQRRSNSGGGRMAVVTYCMCAVYLNIVASLALWAVVPVVAQLSPTLIVSGSMAPRINTGDVVLMGAPDPETVARGQVVTFDDPTHPGRLLTHRVVHRDEDGNLTTRGDANPARDSTPVSVDDVRGVGQLVVPAVGMPAMWVRGGHWLAVLAWLAGTALALRYTWTYVPRIASGLGWSTSLTPLGAKTSQTSSAPARGQWERPQVSPRSVRWASAALVLAVVAAAAIMPTAMASHGGWTARSENPSNDFGAAGSFCASPGSQTLVPTGDAKINQNTPTTNYGATTDLVIDPRTNRVNRSFLAFNLPVQPARCVLTATLRVYTTAGVAGRTLEVLRPSASWAEGTVAWTGAPGTTGVVTSAASRATAGWVEFNVTDHVVAMYTGVNNGLVLKDATESGGAGLAQTLSSRTGTNPPELVLNYVAVPARPAAPSALGATTLTDARVALAWTDNATTETAYQVQASPGGAAAWSDVASLPAGATSHTVTGLTPASAYDFRVRATNATGASLWSNVASASTNASPPAPTGLNVTSAGVNNVTVAWTDTSETEVSFRVEISPGGAVENWTLAGTAAANATTLNISGLTANTTYKFRVRSQSAAGNSAWSNVITTGTAACTAAPVQTLIATADAGMLQSAPTTALGSTAPLTFLTRARVNDNGRSLVGFGSPAIPTGCAVATATLRLNVTAQTSARTLQVFRVNAAWGETTATWNNQPATTGTAASATGAVGWVQWTVTDQVLAMLAGANHGFLIRDSNEAGGTANDTNMSSREGANPPQLVVTFGP